MLFMHWDRKQAAGRICPMVLAEAAQDGRQGPQTASKGRMGDVAALLRDSPMPQGDGRGCTATQRCAQASPASRFQRGVRGHKGRAQLSGLQGGVSGDQANLQGFSTLLLAWTTPGGGATPLKLHPQTSSQHSAPSSS